MSASAENGQHSASRALRRPCRAHRRSPCRVINQVCDRIGERSDVVCRNEARRAVRSDAVFRQVEGDDRLAERHVVHDLHDRRPIVVGIRRIGNDTHVRRRQDAAPLVVVEIAGEQDVFHRGRGPWSVAPARAGRRRHRQGRRDSRLDPGRTRAPAGHSRSSRRRPDTP